jgi:hypothetical protein
MSIPPKPWDVKYEEKVRVLQGYGPNRAEPVAGASRNRAWKHIWKTYKVEMDHSLDNGYFRVKYLPSNAHCLDYCQDEPDDPEEEGMPDSWFEEECDCGAVHDCSEHDTVESEGTGSVYNVNYPCHWLYEPELPRTLPQEGGDDGNDGDAREPSSLRRRSSRHHSNSQCRSSPSASIAFIRHATPSRPILSSSPPGSCVVGADLPKSGITTPTRSCILAC